MKNILTFVFLLFLTLDLAYGQPAPGGGGNDDVYDPTFGDDWGSIELKTSENGHWGTEDDHTVGDCDPASLSYLECRDGGKLPPAPNEQCIICIDKTYTKTTSNTATAFAKAYGSGISVSGEVRCNGSVTGAIDNANYDEDSCLVSGGEITCSGNVSCDATYQGTLGLGASYYSHNVQSGAEIEVGDSLGVDLSITIVKSGGEVGSSNCFELSDAVANFCRSKLSKTIDNLLKQGVEATRAELGKIAVERIKTLPPPEEPGAWAPPPSGFVIGPKL